MAKEVTDLFVARHMGRPPLGIYPDRCLAGLVKQRNLSGGTAATEVYLSMVCLVSDSLESVDEVLCNAIRELRQDRTGGLLLRCTLHERLFKSSTEGILVG